MNKSVFITGASGGIGYACAVRLARDGFNVAACYSEDTDSAEKLRGEIAALGRECEIYRLDLNRPGDAAAVFEKAQNRFGGFYAVVNCAGTALRKLFTDTSEEEFDRLCNVNFKGVYSVCRACVPYMVRHKEGKIINISSMWGVSGASCEAVYSATKAAVIGLTKALARELAPSNIQVNCVAPGAVDTKMNADLTPDEKAAFSQEIPMGRFGTTEEIANAVSFLASEESSYITAQVITADGGLT